MIIPCYWLDGNFVRMTEGCYLTARKYGHVDEFVIVDDGSPCKDWSIQDDKIKLVQTRENEGFPLAVNTGLREATR